MSRDRLACGTQVSRLHALHDGAASDSALSAHAESCPHCAAERAWLARLSVALRAADPALDPRVWARLGAGLEGRRARTRAATWAWASATVVAASFALWLGWSAGQATSPRGEALEELLAAGESPAVSVDATLEFALQGAADDASAAEGAAP